MKTVIVYDSYFGNTEKICSAIGDVLCIHGEVIITRVGDIKIDALQDIDVLIVSSPTRAFRSTAPINSFLLEIPAASLKGVIVAACDTRINVDELKSRFLKIMVKLFGYAAEPIAKKLEKKGGKVIVSPEGFFVHGTEGPLVEGECERAASWAKQIVTAIEK